MALKLNEFIAETLTGIIGGIDMAKAKMKDSGRDEWVSPPISTVGKGGEIHDADVRVYRRGGYTSKAHLVRFDVALHASETGEAEGGVKVVVASVSGKTMMEEKSVSRVRFDIPLVVADPKGC